MQQLDQVIQQNASAAEEMAGTAEELASQASILQTAIAFFKIDSVVTQPVRRVAREGKPAAKTHGAGHGLLQMNRAVSKGASIELGVNTGSQDAHDSDFAPYKV
jgi:methyl-accepting chemotaxis protein